jgi:hypothetical protein
MKPKRFTQTGGLLPRSQGGSQSALEVAHQKVQENYSGPGVAARIYAPVSVVNMDQTDPRYAGKSDNVENIYMPAPVVEKPRSGVQQIFSWLLTGRMK